MATVTEFLGGRSRPARNLRYLTASSASLLLWYGVNFWPGWSSIPVVADEVTAVLGIVNLWLIAVAVTSAVFIVWDVAWFKAACQTAVAGIGAWLAYQLYVVFPFDFSRYYYYDFRWLVRGALVLLIALATVKGIVHFIKFVTAANRTVADARFARQVRAAYFERQAAMASVVRPSPADWTLESYEASSTLEKTHASVTATPGPEAAAEPTTEFPTRASLRAKHGTAKPSVRLRRTRRRGAGAHAAG